MKKLILLLLLSGCSVFKSSVHETDTSQKVFEQRDILKEVIEDIQVNIPPKLFYEIYRPAPDTHVSVEEEPVTITITRKQKTQDNTTVETQTQTQETTETMKQTETKVVNFGGGFVVGMLVVSALCLWVVIKLYT